MLPHKLLMHGKSNTVTLKNESEYFNICNQMPISWALMYRTWSENMKDVIQMILHNPTKTQSIENFGLEA